VENKKGGSNRRFDVERHCCKVLYEYTLVPTVSIRAAVFVLLLHSNNNNTHYSLARNSAVLFNNKRVSVLGIGLPFQKWQPYQIGLELGMHQEHILRYRSTLSVLFLSLFICFICVLWLCTTTNAKQNKNKPTNKMSDE